VSRLLLRQVALVADQRFDVVVVGGGVAGLAAATAVAEAGLRVLVLEARGELGGRATAFRDRETGELVDNGQHVLFGCYRETFRLLRRIDAERNVQVQPRLEVPYLDRAGRRSVLRCPRLPPPLHLIAGVLGWDALPWSERLGVVRLAWDLVGARRLLRAEETFRLKAEATGSDTRGAEEAFRLKAEATGSAARGAEEARLKAEATGWDNREARGPESRASADETVAAWLTRRGQRGRIRQWLWEPLAVAALNQAPHEAAAEPFIRVLADMFGSRASDSSLVLPRTPLHEMYARPAFAYIQARGGEVRLNALARVRIENRRVAAVSVRGESIPVRHVVAAVPWFALETLLTGDTAPMATIASAASRMTSQPIVTVNLWYDRPIMDDEFVGLPERAMQWVFDKRRAFGESASHLSLVASGADALVSQDRDALVTLAAREVAAGIPGALDAVLLRGTVIREKRATFSLAPGEPARPRVDTPVSGLFLAGDWIDTGLPGTIESASIAGHRAAQSAIRQSAIHQSATGNR
jgi:uncharacterized protein with NAD-binding domain and iron-sulfur cluster